MTVQSTSQQRPDLAAESSLGLSAKRVFDVVLSSVSLAVLSPVLAAIALAIKLEDGGPILFVQPRVGKDGRVFDCYKFRTMVVNAESKGAGLEIASGDDRITRVGSVLRDWSLDEIPQVFNVLKGDMSVVGPRPTVPSQVDQYTTWQRRRLEMKPGMAGWAWIHGRNTIPWERRIELDVWYVDNWSLALDARVFMIGVSKLLKREGVYAEDGSVSGFQGRDDPAREIGADAESPGSPPDGGEGGPAQRLVIVGGGGHGLVVADALAASSEGEAQIEIVGVVDDGLAIGTRVGPTVVVGCLENLRNIEHDAVVIAVGDNRARAELFAQLDAAGESFATVVHPSAVIAPSAKIGRGTVICPRVVVGPDAVVGDDVILNTGATIDHHCCIGDHVHVCPGVSLAGAVSIAEGAFVGTGVSVVPGRSVGEWSTVGAGAAVVEDVPSHVTATGVPARWATEGEQSAAVLEDEETEISVPMSSPDIGPGERAAVAEVVATQWLSMGPFIEDFERRVAEYLGVDCAVAVSSGTAGLHVSLIGAGVERGDLVITTPFSFIASANPVLYEGGIPIFVDIDPETLNIDPELVAEAVSDLEAGRGERWLPPAVAPTGLVTPERTKAIVPVHVFGQPAEMDPLLATAREHGLEVIEDACEALGSQHLGRHAGTFGDAAVFAFYANKQMTTGEGGMVVTNDQEKAALFRSLRNQGRDEFNEWLDHVRLGYNYRLDEMSAALGAVQMQRLDEILEKRSRTAAWYGERLGDIEQLSVPEPSAETTRMSWFVYVVRLAEDLDRDAVMRRLAERRIPSRQYFPPIHLQSFYRSQLGFREGQFPVTERISRSTLALPFSGVMTEEQVDVVCDTLRGILQEDAVRIDRIRTKA